MPFIVTGSNSTRTPAPAGTHIARCIWMIDLGTVTETYNGAESTVRKLILGFELPNELRTFRPEEGETPVIVSREFTTSLGKKANLRKFLEGWRGRAFSEEELKGFDLSILAGKDCMLNIIHKTAAASGNVRAEIVSASRLMKGATAPAPILPTLVFVMAGEFDMDTFKRLPEWIRKKIEASPEYADAISNGPNHTIADSIGNDDDEGIPF